MDKIRLFSALAVLALASSAYANSELDRIYAFQSVGFLRSYDNVDGLFADYVSQAYKDYFAHQSRFVPQDLSRVDAVLTKSKLPYYKVIDDPEILGQLARSTRSESILRTKIQKEGDQYLFKIDWMHSPHMDIMASEKFKLSQPRKGTPLASAEIEAEIARALDRLIAKVPFMANVTGRDNNSVTVNVGANIGLKKGDTLIIATLDEVKKHPLLREIVDWRLTQVGKVEIDTADEAIAFGHVSEEVSGRTIARYQKVIQVIPVQNPEGANIQTDKAVFDPNETPKLGWVSGGLWTGSFSRNFSAVNGGVTSGDAGSGLFFGAKAAGELWLNRDFFANFAFAYGGGSYSQNNLASGAATPAGGVTATATTFLIDFGYSYLVSGDFFGPKGWAKLGYRSTSYSLPLYQSEYTSPISFKGLFIAVGGDLPIRGGFGAILNIDFGLFTDGSDSSNLFGQVSSANDVEFFAGAYYQYTPRIRFQLGIDVLANGATYTNTSSTPSSTSNLTQKVVSLVPGIVYYF